MGPIRRNRPGGVRQPSGTDNLNSLIRYLIHAADQEPQRFGLAAPGHSLADLPAIEAELTAQNAGQPPLDVSTLQENQPDWQSGPSDAGLPKTAKSLSKGEPGRTVPRRHARR